MAEFPAMPLWTDAYLGDTTHLTTIEHGAYFLLLLAAWRSKTHRLPDDDKLLARYTRLNRGQWRRMRPILEPFFRIENGEWLNGRLLDEYEAVKRKQKSAAHAGQASALKRQHRGSTDVDPPYQRGANHLTHTTKPEPVKKGSRARATRLPDGFAPDREYAIGKGMTDATFQHQASQFASHHSSTGRLYVRWERVWQTWVGKWIEYGSQQIGGKTHGQQRPNGSGLAHAAGGATAAAASATADFIANLEQGREPNGGDGAGQTLEHHDDKADG